MDKMTNGVLGTMYLMYNKAIVSGTSDSTSFFKIVWDEDLERRVWICYKNIPI